MKQVLKKARVFAILAAVLAYFGCDDVTNLFPDVTSAFTYTIDGDTGTVTFINISEDADTYVWNFGDGDTSTEINPTKRYAASGSYTVTLKATNVSGASDTSEDVVSITLPAVLEEVTLPITFDDPDVDYTPETFSGTSFAIVDNPDVSGSNDKATKVGAITNSGAAFEGIFFDLGADIDLTTDKSITMNFWSDTPVDLLLKLEEGSEAAVETVVSHGGSGWETTTFDFTSSAQYSRLTLFVDGPGTTAGTFYVDDIEQVGTTGGGNALDDCGGDLVNDFETADDTIFNNFGGGVGTIIDNPDTSVNTSAKVGQYVKNAGEVFAGITIEVDPDIDFNAGVFSIDVSSQAVRQLLFKLEGLGIEQIIPTSGTGWETLTYDFSSVAGNVGSVTAITLIMDNGTAGDGSADWTIQFDNIRLCSNGTTGGGGGTSSNLVVNGDFETGMEAPWLLFPNGGSATLDNTINNGGSWSGKLTVGDTGGNPAFKQERIGGGTVAAGDVVQVQFDLIGSVVQPGAAVNVLLFGESPGGVSFTQVLSPAPAPEATWTTYTASYTIPGGTDVSDGISVLIETVCGAVSGCSVTMNIDNVSVILNP